MTDYSYFDSITDAEWDMVAPLGGDPADIDTAEEILYASYISQGVIKSRPVRAAEMLPDNKQSDLKVATLAYLNLQATKFLNPRSQAVGSYGIIIQTLEKKGRITQQEITTSVRQAVAAEVDAQFNSVSFMIDRKYDAVLIHNAQNQNILSYKDVNDVTKTLSPANSLEALSSVMSSSGDFSQAAINTVRAQAALIPAVVYADWKSRGFGDGQGVITRAITQFYTEPSQTTWANVMGIYARLQISVNRNKDPFADIVVSSLFRVLGSLNDGLTSKFTERVDLAVAARVPNDSAFSVFSVPYAVGGN